MKIDWKLKGFNLLKFNCNKEQIVHPETCADMVQMTHDGNINLTDWLTTDGTHHFSICNNLAEWITTNLGDVIEVTANATWNPNSELGILTNANSISLGYIADASSNPVRVPYATTHGANPTYGLVAIGNGLAINGDNGLLNIAPATTTTLGGIRLGNTDAIGATNRVVRMGLTGAAYVDVSNIPAIASFNVWGATEEPTFDGASLFRIDENIPLGDNTLTYLLDSNEFYNSIHERYSGVDLSTEEAKRKVYPIAYDKDSHKLFTYVDWENTTYSSFNGGNAGLVPTAPSGNKGEKFLTGNGGWGSVFNSASAGLVPNPNGVTNRYLNSNGSWTALNTFGLNTAGVVPGPTLTSSSLFLNAVGQWSTPVNTTYEKLSTLSHSAGEVYVIKGSDYEGDNPTKFLREDGEWHEAGNYEKLTAGSSHTENYVIKGSDYTTGEPNKYLDESGEWSEPTGTTYTALTNVSSTDTNYLVKGPGTPSGNPKFLNDSGGWTQYAKLTDNNHSNSPDVFYFMKGSGYSGTPTKFLREDGNWENPVQTSILPRHGDPNIGYVVKGAGTSRGDRYLADDGEWTRFNVFGTGAGEHLAGTSYSITGKNAADPENYHLAADGDWKHIVPATASSRKNILQLVAKDNGGNQITNASYSSGLLAPASYNAGIAVPVVYYEGNAEDGTKSGHCIMGNAAAYAISRQLIADSNLGFIDEFITELTSKDSSSNYIHHDSLLALKTALNSVS